MTRHCGALAPTTGAPCTQLVGDLEDHCAAGHLCPPVRATTPPRQLVGVAAGVLSTDELLEPPGLGGRAGLEVATPHPAPLWDSCILCSEGTVEDRGGVAACTKCGPVCVDCGTWLEVRDERQGVCPPCLSLRGER